MTFLNEHYKKYHERIIKLTGSGEEFTDTCMVFAIVKIRRKFLWLEYYRYQLIAKHTAVVARYWYFAGEYKTQLEVFFDVQSMTNVWSLKYKDKFILSNESIRD